MKNKIQILVASGQSIVRNGVRAMLEQQGEFSLRISEVETGAEVIDFASKRSLDLIIMDIQMQRTDGLATIRKLREQGNEHPIIAMSAMIDKGVVRKAMEFGALGFIVKDTGVEELTKAIKTVRDGKPYYSNEVAQMMLEQDRVSVQKGITRLNLTKREWQILQLLTEEFTTDEIALALNISKRTVEGHRTNLKSKLQVKTTVGLVKFAMEYAQYNRWAS